MRTQRRQTQAKLARRMKGLKAVGAAVEAAKKRGLRRKVREQLKKYEKRIPTCGTRWLWQLKDLINNLK